MKRLVIKTVIFSFLALALLAGCKDFFHPEGEKSKGGGAGEGTIRIQNASSGFSLDAGDVVILNTDTNASTMNTSEIYSYGSNNYKDFKLPVGLYAVVVDGTYSSSPIQLTAGVTRIVRVTRNNYGSFTVEVIGH